MEQERITVQRRHSARFEFDSILRIGPWEEGTKPDPRSFIPVRCRDISQGGFSFFVEEPLDWKKMVVIVSRGQAMICLTAEMVYQRELPEGERGRYVIGCRFTGRLNCSQGDAISP